MPTPVTPHRAARVSRTLRSGRGSRASRADAAERRRRGTLALGAPSRSLGALLALVLAAACSEPASRPGIPPKHVLVVTVDTLRADRLSCYGHDRPTSALSAVEDRPAMRGIDRLAGDGVAFANAFAPRGMTFPSVATLFTGRSPLEHCAVDNRDVLPSQVTTLAESFRAAGFRTGAFTTNRLLVRGSGIEQGFETFEHDAGPDRDFRMIQRAALWMLDESDEQDRPHFAWVHLMGPHLPYEPTPLMGVDYAARFTDPDYAGEADGSRAFLDGAYRDGAELDALDVEHVRALYDGEVARVDHLVGLLTEILSGELPEQPVRLLDDTLLVLTADHGEELHERHGYWAHSKSVYASVLHVPLVLHHPRSLTGRRVFDELVELQDVMPTVLDWFHLAAPPGTRGRSLLPLLYGAFEGDFERRPAFGLWRDRIFTLRDERWTLVWNPDGVEPDDPPEGPFPIPEVALYDRRSDPHERRDVAADQPEAVAERIGVLQTWRAELVPCDRERPELDPERAEALRAMGYLGDAPDGEAPDDGPNGGR